MFLTKFYKGYDNHQHDKNIDKNLIKGIHLITNY